MELRIRTNREIESDISIINTYAPDMNYNNEEQEIYWVDLKELIGEVQRKNTILWSTGNNGQIAMNEDDKEVVGKWALGNKTEGSGRQLGEISASDRLVCGNTFYAKRWKHGSAINAVQSRRGDKSRNRLLRDNKKRTTWITNISNLGNASTRQNTQRKMIKMQKRIKLKSSAQQNRWRITI